VSGTLGSVLEDTVHRDAYSMVLLTGSSEQELGSVAASHGAGVSWKELREPSPWKVVVLVSFPSL
jgi:hypothetical protein